MCEGWSFEREILLDCVTLKQRSFLNYESPELNESAASYLFVLFVLFVVLTVSFRLHHLDPVLCLDT